MSVERGRRGVPGAVRVLVLLHLALLTSWSLLYPSYLGYDEPQHVDRVVGLLAGDGIEGPGEREQTLGVSRSSDPFYGGYELPALLTPYRAADLAPRGQRPSLEALGGAAPAEGLLPNQLVEHPPLTYALGAGLLAAVPGSDDLPYDRTVSLLRLLDVLLLAPLPLLVWALASRLTADRTVALAAAALSLAVPGLTRVGAMWSNDGLLVVAATAALAALARVLTGDVSRRTGALVGGAVLVALLTKGFALFLVPVVIAAYALQARRARELAGSAAWALGLTVLGLVWWGRNLVLYGAVQPRGFGPEVSAQLTAPRAPDDVERSVTAWLGGFADAMATRFWGGLGVPDAPTFSTTTAALLSAVVVVGAVVAVAAAPRRAPLLVLLSLPVLLLAAAARSSWTTYERTVAVPSPQGRYLYAAVGVLALVTALGWARLLGRAGRHLPLVALAAALLLQLRGVGLVLREFWGVRGLSDLGDGLAEALAVSPWPAGLTVLPPLAAALLAVLALLVVRRAPGTPVPGPAREPRPTVAA